LTISEELLDRVDTLVGKEEIESRSQAFEYLLKKSLKPKVEKAVILAGGKGVRLRPLTLEVPKPLITVKGKPVLEHTIELLKKSQIYDLVVCLGDLGDLIIKHFGDGSAFGVRISYSQESRALGTAGALKFAQPLIGKSPFLLVHGDVLSDIDLGHLIEYHQQNEGLMTMSLTSVGNPREYGMVKLQGAKVTGFLQGKNKNHNLSFLINCGIYVVEPEVFYLIPEKQKSMIEEIVLPKLIAKDKLVGFSFQGKWFDLTSAKEYEQAIKNWT